MFKVNNEDTRTMPFIVIFEQVNADWDFHVKKLKVKQEVYPKEVFPSDKNLFLKKKSEVLSSYIFHLWGKKVNCKNNVH